MEVIRKIDNELFERFTKLKLDEFIKLLGVIYHTSDQRANSFHNTDHIEDYKTIIAY